MQFKDINKKTIEDLDKSIQHFDRQAAIFKKKAVAFEKKGQIKKSKELLSQASLFSSTSFDCRNQLLVLLDVEKNIQSEQIKDFDFYMLRARIYEKYFDLESALDYYNQAYDSQCHNIDIILKLAGVHSRLKIYEKALELYNKALAIDESYIPVLEGKSFCLINLKRDKEAIEVYNDKSEKNSNNPMFFFSKARVFLKLKSYEDALKEYDTIMNLGLDPDNESTYFQAFESKCNCLLKMGRKDDVEIAYQMEAIKNPNNPLLFLSKAKMFFKSKNYSEALEVYNYVLDIIDSQNMIAWNCKMELLLQFEKYEHGLKMCNDAIESNFNQLLANKFKGDILFILQKYDDAIHAYRIALDFDNNGKFHECLIKSCEKAKEKKRVKDSMDKKNTMRPPNIPPSHNILSSPKSELGSDALNEIYR